MEFKPQKFNYYCFEKCDASRGSVLTWTDFKHGLRGGVRVEESPFCKGCPDPSAPEFGEINLTAASRNGDSDLDHRLAVYSCQTGYEVSAGPSERPCLVHGGWAGQEPQCRRVSCGFPGYILNGLVHGQYYLYGDTVFDPFLCSKFLPMEIVCLTVAFSKVTYNCTRGYRLAGDEARTCDENGAWTSVPPECRPVTCNRPPDVTNGEFTSSSSQSPYSKNSLIYYSFLRNSMHLLVLG